METATRSTGTLDRCTPIPSEEEHSSMMNIAPGAEYSPTPGADASSQSSPGSASDHMGVLPSSSSASSSHHRSHHHTQAPLLPGSAALAAFAAGTAEARLKGNDTAAPTTTTNRRQSRLQRNRESARLSRKRRKQYLELLEERVDQLSETLDQARRQHVAEAVTTIVEKRRECLLRLGGETSTATSSAREAAWQQYQHNLSRTSDELRIAVTFSYQQLQSFTVPPAMQFILWLTLQTDAYFRGGRTASERLSAARIGERMLSSGTESAAPSQSMWPLFCNEVGVSYDQEEKLRNLQRTLIQDPKSWIDRHTSFASRQVMQAAHAATQALTVRAGQRERSTLSILSLEQRGKFLAWSAQHRARMVVATRAAAPVPPAAREIHAQQQHVAANLYILQDRLQRVVWTVPAATPLLSDASIKKLSHRPSFEPLGASEERANELNRDTSYASSGSLKRNASEMSMDDDSAAGMASKAQVPSIRPVDAEAAAAAEVFAALGVVQDLLPPAPMFVADPAPLEVVSLPPAVVPSLPVPSIIYQAPAAFTQSAPSFGALQQQHVRKSSFLPAHLNVVPEELWPEGTDDFLLDMIEGDWAIGEGIDMDFQE